MSIGDKLRHISLSRLLVNAFLAVLVGGGVFLFVSWLWGEDSEVAGTAQNVASTTAILIGAAYFAVRFLTGEFWTGLELSIATERVRSTESDGSDILLITVTAVNKRSLSIRLLDAVARIRLLNDGIELAPVVLGETFGRYPVRGERIALSEGGPAKASLRINTNDQLSLIASAVIPSKSIVAIDVIMLGHSPGSIGKSQWVSSVFSSPQEKIVAL